MKVLCNIMVMRSRPMCTLSLPGLSLTLSILCCLMSQRTNFINLLHCKSKINLSVHIQETANKHTSRKRLNGAPDIIVMASTKLQTIYRLSADPEVHIKKKDGHTLSLMSYKFNIMSTLDYMDTKRESDSEQVLLFGLKGKMKGGIYISGRGTDNMCEEMEREQIDRKSHCDSINKARSHWLVSLMTHRHAAQQTQ